MNFQQQTRILSLFLLALGTVCALPAEAAYKYTSIDYPGALCTQVLGINNSGEVVGAASVSTTDCTGPTFGFVYNFKNGLFTPLPTVPGALSTNALGINAQGTIVGSAGDGLNNSAFILHKGAFTLFRQPGWPFSEARAISATGLVSGYSTDNAGNYVGFIYDPEHGTFINVLPSPFTIAQGINARGQVVGNVTVDPFGTSDGFVRGPNGVIRLFSVQGSVITRARGINASGHITGFFIDPVAGNRRGFVTTLTSGAPFQALDLPADNILDVPGATDTIPEGIDDRGRICGAWLDAAGAEHSFVATSH